MRDFVRKIIKCDEVRIDIFVNWIYITISVLWYKIIYTMKKGFLPYRHTPEVYCVLAECLSPYEVALERTPVCDDQQLGWPLSAGCVLHEDQACHCAAEVPRKTHRLFRERDESQRSGVAWKSLKGDWMAEEVKRLRNMYNYLPVCSLITPKAFVQAHVKGQKIKKRNEV